VSVPLFHLVASDLELEFDPPEPLTNNGLSNGLPCQFLRFSLGQCVDSRSGDRTLPEMLLPFACIQEIFTLPAAQLLSVPMMPDWVLGVYFYRNQLLWMIDLPAQLGWTGRRQDVLNGQNLQLNAIALQVKDRSFAVVVPQIGEVETYPVEQMQSTTMDQIPEQIPDQMLPFVRGWFAVEGRGRSLSPVLDPDQLLQDPRLQIYSDSK
jgi:positive phototaxis protein PixI